MNISVESDSSTYGITFGRVPNSRKYIVAIVIVSLLCLCLSVSLIAILTINSQNLRRLEKECHNVCESTDCIEADDYLTRYVDRSIDPCENFYEYTCKKWKENYPFPEHSTTFAVSSIPYNQMIKYINEIILNSNVNESRDKAVIDTLQYYSSCMNIDQIEGTGSGVLKNFLNGIIKAPWFNSDFKPEDFEWWKYSARIFKATGTNYFVRWMINPDISDSRKNMIGLETHSAFYSLSYSLRNFSTEFLDGERTAYQNYMVKVISQLNPSLTTESIKDDVKDILQLERDLYEFMPKTAQERANISVLSISDLQKSHPGINWLEYMRLITDDALEPLKEQVTENEQIQLFAPDYLTKLIEFMDNSTRKRVAANYIAGHLILTRILLLPKTFEAAYLAFIDEHPYKQIPQGRTNMCLDITKSAFPEVVSFLYIQGYLPPKSKGKTIEMVRTLSDQLATFFNNSNWMDPDTRNHAIKKLNKMVMQVGYPDWIASIDQINEAHLNMKGSIGPDILKNQEVAKEFQTNNIIKLLRAKSAKLQGILGEILGVKATYYGNWNAFCKCNVFK